jgi:hypothetical protein
MHKQQHPANIQQHSTEATAALHHPAKHSKDSF